MQDELEQKYTQDESREEAARRFVQENSTPFDTISTEEAEKHDVKPQENTSREYIVVYGGRYTTKTIRIIANYYEVLEETPSTAQFYVEDDRLIATINSFASICEADKTIHEAKIQGVSFVDYISENISNCLGVNDA